MKQEERRKHSDHPESGKNIDQRIRFFCGRRDVDLNPGTVLFPERIPDVVNQFRKRRLFILVCVQLLHRAHGEGKLILQRAVLNDIGNDQLVFRDRLGKLIFHPYGILRFLGDQYDHRPAAVDRKRNLFHIVGSDRNAVGCHPAGNSVLLQHRTDLSGIFFLIGFIADKYICTHGLPPGFPFCMFRPEDSPDRLICRKITGSGASPLTGKKPFYGNRSPSF